MPEHDPLGDGQADAGALEFLAGVQPAEGGEQLGGVGHVEAGAVVPDEEGPLAVPQPGAELDPGGRRPGGILPGVVQQVLQGDAHQPLVAEGPQARGRRRRDPAVRIPLGQGRQDRGGLGAQVHGPAVQLAPAQVGELQQVLDEPAHVLGAEPDPAQAAPALRVQAVAVVLQQDVAEAVDGPERPPQVVGDGIGEGLQLLVGRGQPGGAFRHPLLELVVHPADALLGPVPGGDVLERPQHLDHSAPLAHRPAGGVDPDPAAGGGDQLQLQVERRRLPDRPVQGRLEDRDRLRGVEPHRRGHRGGVLGRAGVVDPVGLLGPEQGAGGQVQLPAAHLGQALGFVQQLVQAAQVRLQPAALADVPDQALDVALALVQEGTGAHLHREAAAVAAPVQGLEPDRLGPLDHLELAAELGDALRGPQVPDVEPEQLLAGIAVGRQGPVVDVQQPAGLVHQQDRVVELQAQGPQGLAVRAPVLGPARPAAGRTGCASHR